MGLIREPLNVDFVVDSKPLTKKEKEAVSKYIREYKEKHSRKTISNRRPRRTSTIKKKSGVSSKILLCLNR